MTLPNAVSKAGMEQVMCNAADEYGEVNVRFNALRPGFIATGLMEGIPPDSPVDARHIQKTPMGEMGKPEDIAQLVRFLVHQESRWMTGQIINVDVGHSVRCGPNFTSFVEPAPARNVLLARRWGG